MSRSQMVAYAPAIAARAFAHQHAGAEHEEHSAFVAKMEGLQAGCTTAVGKRDLAAFLFRHKRKHHGTSPGPSGVPLTLAGMGRWIFDLLHVDLNHGKLVWKASSSFARCACPKPDD
eukprot:2964193-Pleurochrysis_carterae.AAC.1